MPTWQNFSTQRIASFQCAPGKQQTIFWDGKTPGLGLRVTSSGAKSYIFETRLHGKTVRITIGDVRTWAIGKAQSEATRLKTLTDQGIDPRQQKEELAAAQAAKISAKREQAVTVAEAWATYIDSRKGKWSARTLFDHQKLTRPGGQTKARGYGKTKAGPLTQLMPLRLIDLTSERIGQWLEDESATRPTQTALAYRLIRAFLRWASGRKEFAAVVNLDAVSKNVAKEHVPRVTAKAGDVLQREQLAAWFDAVKRIDNRIISAYLQTLLLTGARREELAALRWADVDFQWNGIHLADKIEEAGRTIPLTPYVAALLGALPRINEWVFSSPAAASGHLRDPRGRHTQVLLVAGLPHVSLHGLRRSFATLSEWVEAPTGVVAQIMGHKPSAIAEKHYRRRPLDLLRKWHTQIETWILDQAGINWSADDQAKLRLVK